MKNLKDVQKEISVIENTLSVEIREMKHSVWKRQLKKLALLRIFITYLETNPTEDFIKSEIKRLEKVVSAKSKEFDATPLEKKGVPKKEVTKMRKAHEASYGLGKMRTQVRNLRMLLK